MSSCVNALIRPTELFWNRFAAPCNQTPRDLIVADVAMRCFAFIGMMFTLPLYFMGQFIKLICGCYLPVAVIQVGVKQQQQPPAVIRGLRNAEIDQEEHSLAIMNELLANPTWNNYRQLPFDQQYLIAGLFTYPYFWGWHFSTKLTLMNEFQNRFKYHPNLIEASNAIREAIRYQEKILFVARFKEAAQTGNMNGLFEHDRETYRQALHFIAKEHGCKTSEEPRAFAESIIRSRPQHRDTILGLDSLTRHLKDAYAVDYLPDMIEERA